MSEQFMNGRLAAFGAGDVDALVAHYRGDAVVITQQGTLRGPAQIRSMIEGVVSEFARPGVHFTLLHKAAEGPVVNFVWQADTGRNVYQLGAETYVLDNGKVAYQTFAAKIEPK